MKKTTSLALCTLALALAPAYASDLTTEPSATAYWDIPLGTTRAGKPQQSFGLRMDHVVRDGLGASFFSATRTPVVDFRFNASGMQGVYVRGINMATPSIMKLGMSEGALFLALSAGVLAIGIVEMNNNDGTPANNCVTFALNSACVGYQGLGVSCCI